MYTLINDIVICRGDYCYSLMNLLPVNYTDTELRIIRYLILITMPN